MINSLTILSLLKPTMLFMFNLKRIFRLMLFPTLILLAVSIVLFFYPPFFLAQEIRLRMSVNIYTLSLAIFSIVFVFISVAAHVQEILFFEDEKNKKDVLFLPKLNKCFFRSFLVCLKVTLLAMFFSGCVCLVLTAIIRSLVPLPETAGLYFIGGVFLFSPYFIVRFILKFPAQIAEQPLSWIDAWRMTSRINITIGIILILILLAFLMFSVSLYTVLRDVFGVSSLIAFIGNYSIVFFILFACIIQAAFVGYLYPLLDSRK